MRAPRCSRRWPRRFRPISAVEVASLGVQVHGGMGYIEETGAAQHFRDARIAAIYEGTNGIQAIDLVTRKLPLDGGAAVEILFGRIAPHRRGGQRDQRSGARLERRAARGSGREPGARDTIGCSPISTRMPNEALAGASPYLRLFGVATGGCLLAQQALAALRLNADAAARIALARFFAENFAVQAGSARAHRRRRRARRDRRRRRARSSRHHFVSMSTLLDHPSRLSRSPDPARPSRAARPAARHRARAGGGKIPVAGARRGADGAVRDHRALPSPWTTSTQIRDATPSEGMVRLDADTSMSPGSFEAALRAAGGAVHAVDEVVAKKAANAFVATRPPGHHAETARPMGFCLFDNAAIAARYAQDRHGIARAAIVDFDVHHGNGSQEIFWADKTVMYCSTHQMPLYPGTGAVGETRRARHHRQRAAPARRRRRSIPRRLREPHPAAAARFYAGAHRHLRRLRRPHARSARQPQSGRGRFRLGDAKDHGHCRSLRAMDASCRCSKAATICKRWRTRPPRTSPR